MRVIGAFRVVEVIRAKASKSVALVTRLQLQVFLLKTNKSIHKLATHYQLELLNDCWFQYNISSAKLRSINVSI